MEANSGTIEKNDSLRTKKAKKNICTASEMLKTEFFLLCLKAKLLGVSKIFSIGAQYVF